MIDTRSWKYDTACFAAANGYDGFRSEFGRIFKSGDYERIFVLKGGPGTGKSTMMKGVLASLSPIYHKTAIFCSSDPASLDGVILERNGKKTAILDGTSPHERDAVIPGAIDSIIDLGAGFDTDALRSQRDEILRLNLQKQTAYKSAYSYLKAAGAVWSVIARFSLINATNSEAEFETEQLFSTVSSCRFGAVRSVLSSSFGRLGYYKIPYTSEADFDKSTLSGGYIKEQLILKSLLEKLSSSGIGATAFRSPFDPDIIEEIRVENHVFSATTLPCSKAPATASDELDRLYKIHEELLDMAKDAFEKASLHHFALEDIYKRSTDFSANDKAFNKLLYEIESINRSI